MIEQVHPAALTDWFARDPAAQHLLLDVREPWEVQTAHVQPTGYTVLAIGLSQRRTDFLSWGVRRASLADRHCACPDFDATSRRNSK